jgi:hypothetical protein
MQNELLLTGFAYNSKLTARNKLVVFTERRPSPGVGSFFSAILFATKILLTRYFSITNLSSKINNLYVSAMEVAEEPLGTQVPFEKLLLVTKFT